MDVRASMRRVLISVSIGCLAVAGSAVVEGTSASAAPKATVNAPPSVSSAIQAAADSNDPQPVPALTDAYSTTEAEPDGSLEKSTSAAPVRVSIGGNWVPLDPSLDINADGTLSTAATTSPLTLSDGGSAPLATLTSAGSIMSLAWPTSLPTPAVDGATATYGDVLPGVDLQLTANDQGGISEVLVVSDAQAATDPGLDQLALTVHTTNTTLHADDAGNVTGTDAAGDTVFHAPTPIMWDSGDAPLSSTPATDPSLAPPTTAAVAPIDVALTTGQVKLTPDQAMLDDPTTQFPVYIDPSYLPVTKNQAGWAWAQQANPGTSWYNSTQNGNPAVGYQGWDGGYQGENRAFYQFSTGLGNAHIQTASLQLTEVDTGLFDCSASYDIAVYNSGNIGPSTTWNNQPAVGSLLKTIGVTGASQANGCGKKTFSWTVTANVANNTDGSVTFRVQAPSGHEDERNYYRRFGSSGTTGSELFIRYNWPPYTPTNLSMSPAPQNPSTTCDVNNIGWIHAQADGNIELAAQVSDKDQGDGQPVGADFQLVDTWGAGSTDVIAMGAAAGKTGLTTTTNATVRKMVSTAPLHDGHVYGYRAEADDGIDTSAPSAWCYFGYDIGQPTVVQPTSTVFKSDGTGTGTVGTTANFVLSATDPAPAAGGSYSKIRRICYSFVSEAVAQDCGTTYHTVTPTGSAATTSLSFTPTTWGTQYLYVVSLDNAGNKSTKATYQFYVADDPNLQVHPGDVDNDGRPDLLGVVGSNLDILHTVGKNSNHVASPTLAAPGSQAPNSTTWAGALIAHRATDTGDRVDDLWALQNGTLLLYPNALNAPGSNAGDVTQYFSLATAFTSFAPASSSPDYVQTWTDVTSIISLGDVTGDHESDLIMTKVDNGNGSLWFFPSTGTTGQLGTPTEIGFHNWQNYDLIAPGDDTGDGVPDIWARDNRPAASGGTNQLVMFPGIKSGTSPNFSYTISGAQTIVTSGAFGPDERCMEASPGDTDADGYPELYTISTAAPGQLWENEALTRSPSTLTVGPNTVIDDGHGAIAWSTVTALA